MNYFVGWSTGSSLFSMLHCMGRTFPSCFLGFADLVTMAALLVTAPFSCVTISQINQSYSAPPEQPRRMELFGPQMIEDSSAVDVMLLCCTVRLPYKHHMRYNMITSVFMPTRPAILASHSHDPEENMTSSANLDIVLPLPSISEVSRAPDRFIDQRSKTRRETRA